MKTGRKQVVLSGLMVLGGAALVVLASCSLTTSPVTIKERLSQFASDLTSDRTNCYKNFSKDGTQFPTMSSAYWNSKGFSTGTYTVSSVIDSNASAVTATLTGPSPWNSGGSITCYMTQDVSGVYVIKTLNCGSPNVSIN